MAEHIIINIAPEETDPEFVETHFLLLHLWKKYQNPEGIAQVLSQMAANVAYQMEKGAPDRDAWYAFSDKLMHAFYWGDTLEYYPPHEEKEKTSAD